MRKETFWTAASLGAKMLAQILLTLAIVTTFTSKDSGLWFVFMGAGGVLQLFYLGFSSAVLRNSSHLYAGLKTLLPQGTTSEKMNRPNMEGLRDFHTTMGVIYASIGILVAAIAWVVAQTVFTPFWVSSSHLYAWVFFVGSYICQLLISLRFHFMQGAGRLPRAHAVMAFGVFAIFGTAALVAWQTASIMWMCATLFAGNAIHLLTYILLLNKYNFGKFKVNLLKAHWPNGLRSGLSRLSLALIYSVPTIIIGRLISLETGGAYGFSAQVCFFVASLAQLPLYASLPQINMLAGSANIDALRKLFCQKAAYMTLFYIILGFGVIFIGPWALELIHAKTTLLPLPQLAALVFFFFLEGHRTNHVILVSAFNRFPFLAADITTGLVVIIGGFFILGHASLAWFLTWMIFCGGLCIFWWPVTEGLKTIKLSFGRYLRYCWSSLLHH